MTDLRTRIKNAIDQAHKSTHPHSTYDDWLGFAADAVIAALGLRQEQRELMDGMCGQSINYVTGKVTNHYRAATKQRRYVTEWESVDD